jgi:hypothetical protein
VLSGPATSFSRSVHGLVTGTPSIQVDSTERPGESSNASEV